jgi:CubicO group peptidase (beta-lactamase class C family)
MFDPEVIKFSAQTGRPMETAFSMTRRGWDAPLRFQPGESWSYGAGLDWTGMALKKITGLDLEAYLQKNIFPRVGVTSTTFRPLTKSLPRVAAPHRDGASQTLVPGPLPNPLDPAECSGGGGLWGTCRDFAAILRILVPGAEGCGVLTPETVRELFAPQLAPAQREVFAGMMRAGIASTEPAQYPPSAELDQAFGGALILSDVEGKSRAGTMTWGGLVTPVWVS